MPEGHTIHRLARDLRRDLGGRRVAASSPQGRFAEGAARLDGEIISAVDAYGKHLFVSTGGGEVLHVHLGLIGKLRAQASPPDMPGGEIRLRLEGEERTWDLTGPMVCRLGPPDLPDQVTADLGPDPLGRVDGAAALADRLGRTGRPIGAALLDQAVIAGIGNVYRAELLFLLGIDPRRPAHDLDLDERSRLWSLAADLLRTGVRLDRIVTVDPAEVGVSSPGRIPPGERLYVYQRDGTPCRRCGTEIELLDVASRKTWRCPTDQPN